MRTAVAVAVFAAAALGLAVALWQTGETSFWDLPAHMPAPPVPAENPLTRAKVTLGRYLFYDRRLSSNGTTACASCHLQALAFTDGRARAAGATGELHPRSAMSLVNVAYASRLTWANHLLDDLEEQALTPLFGEVPVEMGMSGKESLLVTLLRNDERYAELFPRAFPGERDPFNVLAVVRAIASFVRTIVSFDSPYDRFIGGDAAALTASQQRGMELFNSERLECFHCHGGFNFTDSTTHASAVTESVGFHNTGLYNIDRTGAYPADNTGLHELTGKPRDMGRFRAPTLRNIALTAPYMHDGSIATLDEVLDHYAAGGRAPRNPFKSEFLRGFELSATERADVLAFLAALTDRSVLTASHLAEPDATAGQSD